MDMTMQWVSKQMKSIELIPRIFYPRILPIKSRGAKPPLKCLIKAKFTYLLHFFSFLGQTCQIDYDCWPNNIKFLTQNVKLWRHNDRRHQNGLNAVFINFKAKLISLERTSEEEWNSENRFWLRYVKPEVWDFKEIWVRLRNYTFS